MTSSGYNNGVSESRSYNNDNTLASISYSGAAIGTYSYTWDVNKNKTAESITGVMSGYGFSVGANGYDAEDRLVNWDRSDANLDQAWDLSPVGDWDSFTENASVQNRTHGPTHEILTVATQTVQHDPKGNMTLIPAVLRGGGVPLTMKWDFDNKLRAADTNNDGIDDVFYKWDALGRRIGRDDGTDDVVYFQVGQQTVADYQAGTAASSPTYTYVYGSYIDEMVLRTDASSNELYYHRNGQYSITALTDATGTIAERYAYDAYGELTVTDGSSTVLSNSAYGNRYTYTGREWDGELGLYHYRARMYDPVAGRFTSRDPMGYVDGASLYYGYFAVAFTDPMGMSLTLDPVNLRDIQVTYGNTSGNSVGQTFSEFTINCKCENIVWWLDIPVEIAGCRFSLPYRVSYYKVNMSASLSTRIQINRYRIRNWPWTVRPTIRGVLGHELIHAANGRAKAGQIAARFQQNTFENEEACVRDCNRQHRLLMTDWDEWKLRESLHDNSESPLDGEQYLPDYTDYPYDIPPWPIPLPGPKPSL